MTSGVFWDTSALVKAYTREDGTANAASALALRNVRGFVTDFVTLEVISALGKKARTYDISKQGYRNALSQLRRDLESGLVVLDVDGKTREHSHSLAEKYRALGTSAMDLLHLASAHQAAALCHPRPLVMLCADKPLMEAARAEGFGVYNPETHPQSALRTALNLRS